ITPTLTGFAECVGRNAGHNFGRKVGLQAENVGMRPDIGAIVIHENGNVADDADSSRRAIFAQRAPLLEKCKLNSAADFQLRPQFTAGAIQCRGLAMHQFTRPLVPWLLVFPPQCLEEHKALEPPGILRTEGIKTRSLRRVVVAQNSWWLEGFVLFEARS